MIDLTNLSLAVVTLWVLIVAGYALWAARSKRWEPVEPEAPEPHEHH